MKHFLTAIALPLIILFIWAMLSITGAVDPLFLPNPFVVAKSVVSGFSKGGFTPSLIATVARSLTGFAMASIVGIPLGLLIGRIPSLARTTQPTIDFFRSVPATALFPLFLFFFGIGDAAKVAVVVYACSLIVLVNTAYAALQVKTPRLLSAKVMGATDIQVFWKIVVPESFPGIFAGLRIALSLSFVLVIVTEMFIGTTVGLGYEIINAQLVYRVPDMYAAIFVAGVLGYLANAVIIAVEKRLLHWVGK